MDPKDEVSNTPPPQEETVITPQFVPVDSGAPPRDRLPIRADAPAPWWTWVVPGARRAHQMRNLQAGTAEVMQLVRSIHQNLEQQVETQRLLVSSLSALPEAVEGLRNIGRATEAQREMMVALQRQMTANAGSMDRFNDTLLSMDGTTKSIAERAKSSEAALFDLLRRAQRRMAMLTVLLILTIAGVAGLAGYLLTGGKLPNLSRIESAPPAGTPPASPATPVATMPEEAAPVAAAAEAPAPDSQAPATPSPETSPPEAPAVEAPTPVAAAPEAAIPENPAPEAPPPEPPATEVDQPEAAPAPAPVPAEADVPAEDAVVTPEPAPAPAPVQPTEASLRLEKLLKELRERGSAAPPEAPQSPPLKP